MKTLVSTVLASLFLTTALYAQGVEPVGWLPYWGEFFDVEVTGNTALVVNSYGLLTFDVSDPSQPELLDHFPIPGKYWDNWRGVEIQIVDDVAIVQAGDLYRFDISDPSQLELLPELPNSINELGHGFVQKGDYLYASRYNQLYVIDVSEPLNPAMIDTLAGYGAYVLCVRDDILIAADYSYWLDFRFLSLENPESPQRCGSFRSDSANSANPSLGWKPWIVENRCYYASEDCFGHEFIECVDFTDPNEPYRRWIYEMGSARIIGLTNDLLTVFAYINSEYSLSLYSTSNPDTLIKVADIPYITYPGETTGQSGLLYLAGNKGLYSFDMENLDDIELLGGFRSRMCMSRLVKIGEYLTVSLNDSTIRVISAENPESPREVSSYRSEGRIYVYCKWTSPGGQDYIIARDSHYNLNVLSFSDGHELELAGLLNLIEYEPDGSLGSFGVAPWDNGIVVTASMDDTNVNAHIDYFFVVSLENPERPEIIGAFTEMRGIYQPGFGPEVVVNGEYAYIPDARWYYGGSWIVSIEDPTQPRIITHEEHDEGFYYPVTIEHDLMFANGELYSLADPVHPELLGEIDQRIVHSITASIQFGLVVFSDYKDASNFHLYNIRDPQQPRWITSLNLPDFPNDILLQNGLFYVIESSGIEVLRYTGEDYIPEPELSLPDDLHLESAYPNPFNSMTYLSYTLPFRENTRLSIVDLSGREIEVLVYEEQVSGCHRTVFDASTLPTGVYVARLEAGDAVRCVKLVCVK